MKGSKQRVAVFDVDGTIFRSSLLVEVVERLIFVGAFTEEVQDEFEKQHEKWLNREGDYEEYIQAVVRSFLKHLKGMKYTVLADAAEIVVEDHWKRVYTYTRDLLDELKRKDYFLLAVSHSPKTVLDMFCPRLGFDKVYGTFYETGAEGAFTGKIVDEHIIFNKAAVLKRAVEKHDLTLAHSIGVGDTESDIPFLDLVAKPICFNPNNKLFRHAKREGWKVVVERKDVIYQL
ncbi:MAG: HAD-IB family phosphatase [Minisyncoccia bacterium]